MCIATANLADPVIHLLYGPQYAPSVPVMRILALVIPFMYVGVVLNQISVAAKRPLTWTWIMAAAAVLNPILNLILIRKYQASAHNGAIGAALSLLLTELVVVVLGIVVTRRRVDYRHSLRRVAGSAVAASGMWAAMYACAPTGVLAEGAAGAGTYALLAIVFRAVPLHVVRAQTHIAWKWARSTWRRGPVTMGLDTQ